MRQKSGVKDKDIEAVKVYETHHTKLSLLTFIIL